MLPRRRPRSDATPSALLNMLKPRGCSGGFEFPQAVEAVVQQSRRRCVTARAEPRIVFVIVLVRPESRRDLKVYVNQASSLCPLTNISRDRRLPMHTGLDRFGHRATASFSLVHILCDFARFVLHVKRTNFPPLATSLS